MRGRVRARASVYIYTHAQRRCILALSYVHAYARACARIDIYTYMRAYVYTSRGSDTRYTRARVPLMHTLGSNVYHGVQVLPVLPVHIDICVYVYIYNIYISRYVHRTVQQGQVILMAHKIRYTERMGSMDLAPTPLASPNLLSPPFRPYHAHYDCTSLDVRNHTFGRSHVSVKMRCNAYTGWSFFLSFFQASPFPFASLYRLRRSSLSRARYFFRTQRFAAARSNSRVPVPLIIRVKDTRRGSSSGRS